MVSVNKDAIVCQRLLTGCLRSCRSVCDILTQQQRQQSVENQDSHHLTDLMVTTGCCQSLLARTFNPATAPVLVEDTGFQSWTLVLFELLSLFKWKLEFSILHGTLELCLHGPRLWLFFERLEAKIGAHIALLQPHLDAFVSTGAGGDAGPNLAERLHRHPMLVVDHLIEDDEGREWWIQSFGRTTYAVPWKLFLQELANHPDPKVRCFFPAKSNEESTSMNASVSNSNTSGDDEKSTDKNKASVNSTSSQPTSALFCEQLREALSPQRRRAVTVFQWSEFLFSYGPGVRVALIQLNAPGVAACKWFAGALTYDEARSVLTPCVPGTFLVRFSESATCTWAVSYCDARTGLIKHALVQASSSKSASHEDHFSSGGRIYTSLLELVESNAGQLQFPAPNIKNLGPARFFRDFLTFEEARDMLEDQKPGTFLVRFSVNQEGCLVVAYVEKGGGVLQSKIYCDKDKGFTLGGQSYKRMSVLVKCNRDKLRFPLAVAFKDCAEEEDKQDETKIAAGMAEMLQLRRTNNASMYGAMPISSYGGGRGAVDESVPVLGSSYLPLETWDTAFNDDNGQSYGLTYAALSEGSFDQPSELVYQDLGGDSVTPPQRTGAYGSIIL